MTTQTDPDLNPIDPYLLTGQTNSHVVLIEDSYTQASLHTEVAQPFHTLVQAAHKAGFGLSIASGFRDFDRQLKIWNEKVNGIRPLMDSDGRTLIDVSQLSPSEIIFKILRWSALPGASRHHWGTDLDVYDPSAVPKDYLVRLSLSEVNHPGAFAPLHDWLDQNMHRFQFFRPYAHDRGGVSPERWHISYFPLSNRYLKALTFELLRNVIQNSEIALKKSILDLLPEIYERFTLNIENHSPV